MDSSKDQGPDNHPRQEHPPRLADLEEADLRQWLALPPGRLLVLDLQAQCDELRSQIALAVESDRGRDAAVAVGALRAFEGLLLALHPQRREPPAIEEQFYDPARIVAPPMKTPKEIR